MAQPNDTAHPLPDNIVQQIKTTNAEIYLSGSDPANIYVVMKSPKDGKTHCKFTHPTGSVCNSIALSYKPTQWGASFQAHCENVPLSSPFGMITALKFDDNPDTHNTVSLLYCEIYNDNEEFDNCPISLPDKRLTKLLYVAGFHKYMLWRENIVVCCDVKYACMGRQSGHTYHHEISVPPGTTAVTFSDKVLTFVSANNTTTQEYDPFA